MLNIHEKISSMDNSCCPIISIIVFGGKETSHQLINGFLRSTLLVVIFRSSLYYASLHLLVKLKFSLSKGSRMIFVCMRSFFLMCGVMGMHHYCLGSRFLTRVLIGCFLLVFQHGSYCGFDPWLRHCTHDASRGLSSLEEHQSWNTECLVSCRGSWIIVRIESGKDHFTGVFIR